MLHARTPRTCTYCPEDATEYRLYGPGEGTRPNRAVPVCGPIPCALRADRSARNTNKRYYCTTPLRAGINPI